MLGEAQLSDDEAVRQAADLRSRRPHRRPDVRVTAAALPRRASDDAEHQHERRWHRLCPAVSRRIEGVIGSPWHGAEGQRCL